MFPLTTLLLGIMTSVSFDALIPLLSRTGFACPLKMLPWKSMALLENLPFGMAAIKKGVRVCTGEGMRCVENKWNRQRSQVSAPLTLKILHVGHLVESKEILVGTPFSPRPRRLHAPAGRTMLRGSTDLVPVFGQDVDTAPRFWGRHGRVPLLRLIRADDPKQVVKEIISCRQGRDRQRSGRCGSS